MIISHKHKFIFVKTKKVAGTSLEIALSKYCSNDDILSPIMSEGIREKLGFTTARNYRKSLKEMTYMQMFESLNFRRTPGKRIPKKYFNHIRAADIRDRIGEEIWNDYFKFTLVRNPFDKLVSQYHWKNRRISAPVSFDVFIRQNPQLIRENWNIYTENNEILVDDFVKYENLESDLERISEKIGLPDNVFHVMSKINAKGNVSPKNKDYSEIIGKEEKQLLTILGREEIDLFGYRI